MPELAQFKTGGHEFTYRRIPRLIMESIVGDNLGSIEDGKAEIENYFDFYVEVIAFGVVEIDGEDCTETTKKAMLTTTRMTEAALLRMSEMREINFSGLGEAVRLFSNATEEASKNSKSGSGSSSKEESSTAEPAPEKNKSGGAAKKN